MNMTHLPQRCVVFVSNGGICRAPMAAGVLRRLLQEDGRPQSIQVASAAISDAHIGSLPDALAIVAAADRGYDIRDIRVRKVEPRDFNATAILAVDAVVLASLRGLAPHGFGDRPRLLGRCAGLAINSIVDPYGGAMGDYQLALDLIEASCRRLVAPLLANP